MNDIPERLKNPDFRFYLVRCNSKEPLEAGYIKDKNYRYFDTKIMNNSWNVGILTGYGNLIVLDFDSNEYYNQKKAFLRKTFTVTSATKGMPHLYYYLEGDMIRTKGIDMYYSKLTKNLICDGFLLKDLCHRKAMYSAQKFHRYLDLNGLTEKRVCDIMGARGKVICPPSTICRKYYDIKDHAPIATITKDEIEAFFSVKLVHANQSDREEYHHDYQSDVKAVNDTIKQLQQNGIKRTAGTNFKCPLHHSEGEKCLTVMPSGKLYCFHCLRTFSTVENLIREWKGA